jgi:hypothetical protein
LRNGWLSNERVMMVSPRLLKGCEAQIGTRIMSKWILTASLFLMTMVENMVDLVNNGGVH